MVKVAGKLLAILALVAALSGCNPLDLLHASIFPPDLTRREAWADLSAEIPAEQTSSFQASIAETGGGRVIVLLSTDWTFTGVHLVVLDGDLKLLAAYSQADLDALSPGVPFDGGGVTVDVDGMLAIGNRLFSVGAGGLSYLKDIPSQRAFGVAIPEHNRIASGIHLEGTPPNTLHYDLYNGAWMPMAGYSVPYGSVGSYRIITVFSDPAKLDIYLLTEGDRMTRRFLALPRWQIAMGTLSSPPPILEGTYPFVEKLNGVDPVSELDPRFLGYTTDGFAACRKTSAGEELVLFDGLGTVLRTSAVSWDLANQRHLYGRTDGWYIMDTSARTMVRYSWWWQ